MTWSQILILIISHFICESHDSDRITYIKLSFNPIFYDKRCVFYLIIFLNVNKIMNIYTFVFLCTCIAKYKSIIMIVTKYNWVRHNTKIYMLSVMTSVNSMDKEYFLYFPSLHTTVHRIEIDYYTYFHYLSLIDWLILTVGQSVSMFLLLWFCKWSVFAPSYIIINYSYIIH